MRKVKTITSLIVPVLLVVVIYLATGCATLFKGASENVDFSSDPSGADVYVNGSLRGKTPINLKLESKKTYTIEFKKEGHEPRSYTITNHVGAGWIILDILGGLIPIIVDAATGAWYELDQDAVNVVLKEQQ